MTRQPTDRTQPPTGHEEFLYHLAELEKALKKDVHEWNVESAIAAQRRLDRLVATLRRRLSEIEGG